jgi:NAD-dependent DNA ligase
MDTFTRFNRKSLQDRQIDTLIGLSKGLAADKKIDQAEAEFLLSWLIQNRQTTDNPVIANLLDKVSAMLSDDLLDEEESSELLATLDKICGEHSEIGELAKTSSLPIDDPMPSIAFPNKQFLFTGTFAFGTRKQCHEATEARGGIIAKKVTKSIDYLVIGTYVTDSWIHESFGRKIEKAMQYRDTGTGLVIITEEHWINEGRLT